MGERQGERERERERKRGEEKENVCVSVCDVCGRCCEALLPQWYAVPDLPLKYGGCLHRQSASSLIIIICGTWTSYKYGNVPFNAYPKIVTIIIIMFLHNYVLYTSI